MQEANASQAARLDDAASLLADKDRLEETVKKQHALIEQRGQELKVLKAQLDGKEAALDKARCVRVHMGVIPSECPAAATACQHSKQHNRCVTFGTQHSIIRCTARPSL